MSDRAKPAPEDVLERHRPVARRPYDEIDARGDLLHAADKTPVCYSDRRKWPCDATQMAERAQAAEADAERLYKALRMTALALASGLGITDAEAALDAALAAHDERTKR